jgi:hypothetical protein
LRGEGGVAGVENGKEIEVGNTQRVERVEEYSSLPELGRVSPRKSGEN